MPSADATNTEPGRGAPCRSCGATLKRTVVDLGMSPLCESYLAADELNRMEPFNLLHVMVADDLRGVGPQHLEGVDAVVHLAALSNDPLSNLDPELTYEITPVTEPASVSKRQAGADRTY
jgi:hypothetical protein